MSYKKFEKINKLCPQGIVVDGLDLIAVINKQNLLLHEFRHMKDINPKKTGVRDDEIYHMIRGCFE